MGGFYRSEWSPCILVKANRLSVLRNHLTLVGGGDGEIEGKGRTVEYLEAALEA